MIQEETVPPRICDMESIFAGKPSRVERSMLFITGPAIDHGNSFDHQKTKSFCVLHCISAISYYKIFTKILIVFLFSVSRYI